MESFFQITEWYLVLGLVFVLLLAFTIVFYFFVPKKRLCKYCKSIKTRHKNQERNFCCEECDKKIRFSDAIWEEPNLHCPIHGIVMDKRIILDSNDIVVHECPDPSCHIMLLNKTRLKEISLLELEFYPKS